MKKIFIFAIGFLFAQTDVNFSLETKYGEGTSIKNQGSTEEPYNYFENILDINIQFNSGVSLWSQLEYSDPPIFGISKDGLNKFYFEYNNDNLNVKAGDIYTLFGNGLSLNMVLNQNVDLDNSIKGIEFELYPNDNVRLFSLIGKGQYDYRTNPAQITTDRSIYSRVYSGGIEYYSENWGIFQTFHLNQSAEIGEEMMMLYNNEHLDTRIGKEFYNRVPFEDFRDDTLSSKIHNINYTHSIGPIDVFLEYSKNKYSKLLGDEIDGYKLYGALSTYLAGFGITYEFKDYNEPYFIQSLSGAPIVYRESTSILASRYNHSINFGDEIGHQLEVQYSFNDNLNWMFNISQANSHIGEYDAIQFDSTGSEIKTVFSYNHSNPISLIFMKGNDEDIAFKPFRQLYTEVNGYGFSGNFYYQIGVDQMDEVYKYYNTKEFELVYNDLDEYLDSIQTELTHFDSYIESELIFLNETFNIDTTELITDFDLLIFSCATFGDIYCDGLSPTEYADSMNAVLYDSLIVLENEYNEHYANTENELTVEKMDLKTNRLKSKKYSYEKQSIITLPMRFSWKFKNGASISTYWEHQWRIVEMNHDYLLLDGTVDSRTTNKEKYYNQYISVSYRSPSKWSLTLFYDGETFEKKLDGEIWDEGYNNWTGVDFSFDINSSSQMSLFFGSQKGGRICANGICADQPGFKDGFKLTYRSFF